MPEGWLWAGSFTEETLPPPGWVTGHIVPESRLLLLCSQLLPRAAWASPESREARLRAISEHLGRGRSTVGVAPLSTTVAILGCSRLSTNTQEVNSV